MSRPRCKRGCSPLTEFERLRQLLLDAESLAEELGLSGTAFSIGQLADVVWDEWQERLDDGGFD